MNVLTHTTVPLPLFEVRHQDCILGMRQLPNDCAQVVIADPPYNINKDFGNNQRGQSIDEYVKWCREWLTECRRILKPGGTLFVYGFSEVLMFLGVEVTSLELNVKWLVWHYTNKTVPSLKFWQRSHESILCCWKGQSKPVFNRDDIREPYSKNYLKCKGKRRAPTKGRFGQKETTYNVNDKGALPRDVIKHSTLAGGAGRSERVNHPTQKPLALAETLLKSALRKNTDGTYSDQLVIIPFCGSGTEVVACYGLGVKSVAYEINPDYIELTLSRLPT